MKQYVSAKGRCTGVFFYSEGYTTRMHEERIHEAGLAPRYVWTNPAVDLTD